MTDRVMAGSLMVRMLNCYFAVCHVQMPVIDIDQFRATFNAAQGGPRKMTLLTNGGDPQQQGAESSIAGIESLQRPTSKISTPGSVKALLAILIAWAARYTDAPVAFDTPSKDATERSSSNSSSQSRQQDRALHAAHRRKRGVACDSCRL